MEDLEACHMGIMENLMDHMVCLMDPMKDMLAYLTDLMDHLWDRIECLTISMEDMDTVMDTVMDTITDSSLIFLVYVGQQIQTSGHSLPNFSQTWSIGDSLQRFGN